MDLLQYAAEHLEASRARCSLPARVEDQEALRRIAALVRTYQQEDDAPGAGIIAGGGAVVTSDREPDRGNGNGDPAP